MRLSRPVLGLALLLGGGCAADAETLSVPVSVAASVASFTDDDGVAVEIERARFTLADLRLDGPASAARAPRGWSLLSVAHAHPGHGAVGEVVGELSGTWTVELVDGGAETALGEALCRAGEVVDGRLSLAPSPALELAGRATVDGVDRDFAFVLAPELELAGLALVATLDPADPPAGLRLTVDLAQVLSFADWRTPDDDGDGMLGTGDGELANTLAFGVASTPAYRLQLLD